LLNALHVSNLLKQAWLLLAASTTLEWLGLYSLLTVPFP
jgi:hypothetical protein